MEGKPQKASGSTSAPKSTGSSRLVQREVERSGAVSTNTAPDVSESSRPSTVTFSREQFVRMIQLLKPDVDPALLLAQVEADPAPPTNVQQMSQPLHTEAGDIDIEETHSGATLVIEDEDTVGAEMEELLERGEEVEQRLPITEKNVDEPTTREDDVMDIVRQITMEVEPNSTAKVPEETQLESNPVEIAEKDDLQEEGEQLLLTTEEVVASFAVRYSDIGRVDVEVEEDRNARLDPTEKMETGDVETSVDVSKRSEIVIVTDEEEETEGVPPVAEIVQPEAVAVLTYQRRPTRDEASEQRLG